MRSSSGWQTSHLVGLLLHKVNVQEATYDHFLQRCLIHRQHCRVTYGQSHLSAITLTNHKEVGVLGVSEHCSVKNAAGIPHARNIVFPFHSSIRILLRKSRPVVHADYYVLYRSPVIFSFCSLAAHLYLLFSRILICNFVKRFVEY